MVPMPVASIRGSGLAHPLPLDVFSRSFHFVQFPGLLADHTRALTNGNDSSLRVYSTGDGPDVYEDSFMQIAQPDGGEFHPTLLLVGTRLGIDKVTPVYWQALIASLQMPQSIGIAG